jgi:hypothetical protein
MASTNIDGDSKVKEIRWADIVEVVAYKRFECFPSNLVTVALVGHENVLELSEEMNGWDELLDHFTEYLPGCQSKDNWYPEVKLPPFMENRKIIFSRH